MEDDSAKIRMTIWLFLSVLLIAGLGSSLSAYALGWLTMFVGFGMLGLNVWRYWDLSERQEEGKGLRLEFVLSSLLVILGMIAATALVETPLAIIRFVVAYVLLMIGFVLGNMLTEFIAEFANS